MRLISFILFFIINNSFSQKFDFSIINIKDDNIILEEISGVGLDSENNILIFHRGKNSLIKINQSGNILKIFNDDIFFNSHGLKIDKYDNIWTTDLDTHMITKMDKNGTVQMVIGKKNTPGFWLTDNYNMRGFSKKESMPLFNKPADIAFDNNDNIYVADGYGNNRIVKFNSNGKYITEWGLKGDSIGHFDLPHGITIDDSNKVYVADRENARIQVFSEDGVFLDSWDDIGFPYGIKYFDNNIYMTDARNERIKKIKLNGEILWEIGSPGKGIGEFGWAHGIDIDKEGNIFVSEILNWRIQKILVK